MGEVIELYVDKEEIDDIYENRDLEDDEDDENLRPEIPNYEEELLDHCKFKSVELRKISNSSTLNNYIKKPELNFIIDIVKQESFSNSLFEERKYIFEETIKEFLDIEKSGEMFVARISIKNLTNINFEQDLKNKRGYIDIISYPGGSSLIDIKHFFDFSEDINKTFTIFDLKWPVINLFLILFYYII
jgi:hypothetical protein